MFRLCWEKFIIDKKVTGYYLWERVLPFKYKEVLSGVESLTNYFIKDDLSDTAEHIISKKQLKNKFNTENYKNSYKTHVNMSQDKCKNGFSFDYGSYDDFIAEFTKQELSGEWKREKDYPESFFDSNGNSRIHADMFMFNGVLMIMKTIGDFIKVEEFIKENKYAPNEPGVKVDKWSLR